MSGKGCAHSICGLVGQINFADAEVPEGHPEWFPLVDGEYVGLNVHNSLTERIDPFKPAQGRRVLWYTCGPTVYDYCHMGHARAYLTFDILRRIIEDYFGYNVLYHSNITDIDDKIILRARQNKLFDDYAASIKADSIPFEAVRDNVLAAVEAKGAKMAAKAAELEAPPADTSSRAVKEWEEEKKTFALKNSQFEQLAAAVHATVAASSDLKAASDKLLEEGKGLGLDAGDGEALAAAAETLRVALLNEESVAGDVSVADVELLQAKVRAVIGVATSGATATILREGRDALVAKLDKELGATITDKAVFDKLARKFEKHYMEDMEALGIKEPDVLTRVTEYVPQIVDYIRKIEEKGLAYESQGSVYLDTAAFQKSGHNYRKLNPFKGDTSANEMAESEGALGSTGEKRNPNDFALWKASKAGEPRWESPWGEGRPGWHIECSVVASDILGQNMDVHAGGNDLKFPHHDNELAQSEAYYGHQQWVNYFFHAGWLKIKGLKMSKSLKNFITIRQALETHTARQLRLMFLLQSWDKELNYSDQAVADACSKERLFKNFFGSVKDLLRNDYLENKLGYRNPEADRALMLKILDTKDNVHAAFCDNFDTVRAVNALVDLVTEVNKYLEEDTGRQPAVLAVQKAALYVTTILRVLGVAKGQHKIGFGLGGGEGGGDKEALLTPYLDALNGFRSEVREAARAAKADPAAVAGRVLAACDAVRDDALPGLGVRLEDMPEGTRWKLDDPAVLLAEIAAKREAEAARAAQKKVKAIKKVQSAIDAAIAVLNDPAEFFTSQKDPETGEPVFGSFDAEGFPQTDAAGAALAKGTVKKCTKTLKAYLKKRGAVEKLAGGVPLAEYIAAKRAELSALTGE